MGNKGPAGENGPDNEHNRKVSERILGALGIKNLREEGKPMDMDHAKIEVTVRRVAGVTAAAEITLDGGTNLIMNGLVMLIWRVGKRARHGSGEPVRRFEAVPDGPGQEGVDAL